MKLPPVALTLIVAALMWGVSLVAPSLEFQFPVYLPFSMGVALVGAAICLSAVVSFRRAKTTVNPLKPGSASALVVSGIYKFTRNPMYLGFLLVLLGWAMFLSNALALVLIPGFVIFMNRFQIVPEERALTSLFVNKYSTYTARVRRWI